MKIPVVCYLALLTPLFAENLFDNSTMDTTGGWKGTKKFVNEEADGKGPQKPAKEDPEGKDKLNRCLLVTAKARDQVSFNQEADTKDMTDLTLKFRYRTKDYIGRGINIRGTRQNRSATFKGRVLIADGQWHEITWEFTRVQGSHKIDFTITVLEGTGDVYFDDITVEALKK